MLQNAALRLVVKRLAAGVAEWEVTEHEPRHATLLDDVAGGADDDGRDAVRFEVPGYQTHGLVADRSDTDQDRGVDLCLTHPLEDHGRVALDRLALAAHRWYAVELLSESADAARGGGFLQSQ